MDRHAVVTVKVRLHKLPRGTGGFTLIELVIALVILGLLIVIALALPSHFGARKRAANDEAPSIHARGSGTSLRLPEVRGLPEESDRLVVRTI